MRISSAIGSSLLVIALLASGCGGARATADVGDVPSEAADLGDGEIETTEFAPELNVVLLAMEKLPQGIYYRDMTEGDGVPAMPGRDALISYVAYLADGTEVDRTAPGARPIRFTIGEGQVIRGWDLGVRGMRTGGTRQLVVPSRYAYGRRAIGKIPANSVMVFILRLDAVR